MDNNKQIVFKNNNSIVDEKVREELNQSSVYLYFEKFT